MSNTVKVKKSNRVLVVSEDRAAGYLKRGYDQIDQFGKIVKHATDGKSIPIAEYNRVRKELQELKESQQQPAITEDDYKALQDELEDVKAKAEQFAQKGKDLQEENKKLKKQLHKN